jgi:uncharacterized lipoprotein YbaY
MALGFRRNFSSSLVILAAAACSLSDFAVNSAQAQATIRRRDLVSDWSTTAPNLTSAAPGLTSAAPLATQTPQAAYVPSWNSQPNSWRLGVAIDNADTGVVLTDVERGTPADRAGLKRGDVIVNVGGYQVGYVNGGLFDLGDEIRRRVGQDGKVSFLVFDQTQRRLTNMPIVLVQQSSAGIQGQVVCNERITLTTQAVLTVRLRDVTYPNWQSIEVGNHVIPSPPHPPIPFAIQVNQGDIYPDHRYAVDAYLVDRGQIVLQSPSPVPVSPLSNNGSIQVSLVRVGGSTPPSSTYAVGQLDQIAKWYRQYLQRDATTQELSAWQNYLQAGKSPQDILAYILGSPEYFDRMGNQRDPYLASVFQNLNGRQPTATELQQFASQYQQYGGVRTDFVRDVLRVQPNSF